MNGSADNPYRTPESDLVRSRHDKSVLKFKRFSTWAVLGLSIITFGLYPYYWMYSRANILNSLHEDRISSVLLGFFLLVVALSYVSGFFGESEIAILASLAISLVYLVLYLVVLFKIRNRLQDILNRSGDSQYRLGAILTFFLFSIYLQYKINECIDELPPGG